MRRRGILALCAILAGILGARCALTPEGRLESLAIVGVEIGIAEVPLAGFWVCGNAWVVSSPLVSLELLVRSRAPELWTPPEGWLEGVRLELERGRIVCGLLHPWQVISLEWDDPAPAWALWAPPFQRPP